jgi:hypothetical protein
MRQPDTVRCVTVLNILLLAEQPAVISAASTTVCLCLSDNTHPPTPSLAFLNLDKSG